MAEKTVKRRLQDCDAALASEALRLARALLRGRSTRESEKGRPGPEKVDFHDKRYGPLGRNRV
jgi:hypothetical protein